MGIGEFLIIFEYNNAKCPPAEPPDITNSNLFSSKPLFFKNFHKKNNHKKKKYSYYSINLTVKLVLLLKVSKYVIK